MQYFMYKNITQHKCIFSMDYTDLNWLNYICKRTSELYLSVKSS